MTLDRRALVVGVPGAAAAVLLGLPLPRAARAAGDGPAAWSGFPRQQQDHVRDVVGASHRDEAKVRELVEAHPALANAWWDWGFGDWESALGAAAHTGRRNIAEYLVSRGARVDIFAAAMLGWVDVVKGFVAASPGVQRTLGPHCLTLMHHARAGGDAAAGVVEYLTTLGDADSGPTIEPLTPEAKQRYVGTYSYGSGEGDRFDVRLNKEWLEFVKDGSSRRIHHVGSHEFFPSGVPSVRLKFEVAGGVAGSVTVVDHGPVLTAGRLP